MDRETGHGGGMARQQSARLKSGKTTEREGGREGFLLSVVKFKNEIKKIKTLIKLFFTFPS